MDDTKYISAAIVTPERPWITLGMEKGAELQIMQSIVAGRVEAACTHRAGVVMFINDEGKLRGMQPNRAATHLYINGYTDPIVGNAVIVRIGDEGEIVDLTEEDLKWLEIRNGRRNSAL